MKRHIIAMSLMAASATSFADTFNIEYIDSEGFGAYDTTPVAHPGGEMTTLGAYRQESIELATRAVALQFNTGVEYLIHVNFGVPEGYGATTSGPNFSEFTEFDKEDEFGLLEIGRKYPMTLQSALVGVDLNTYDEDAVISFSDTPSYAEINDDDKHPYVVYAAYHEMMHFMGFVALDCLGNCIPEPSSPKTHLSSHFYYNDDGTVRVFDNLTIDEKTTAYKSTNNLWFGGSDTTKQAANNELTGGVSDGYIYIHATPEETTGNVDPQGGSHFAPDVQPAQLMHSYGASTEDIGMAAYLLCDIGWCRNDGKVIEQSVTVSHNENASTAAETALDIIVAENLNVGVDNWQLNFDVSNLSVIDLQSNEAVCTSSGSTYSCEGTLLANDEVLIRLLVDPSESYSITGELRSTGYDVDRNGFNNIADTIILAESSDTNPDPDPDPNTDPDPDNNTDPGTNTDPEPIDTSSSSGGGSLFYLLLPLFGMTALRRLKMK